jgi:phage shock protein PspC (stress-responsive transcriptional regulator)
MKRVEIIHINGLAFSIEDEAYGRLSAYMDALDTYFKTEPGGEEIMADIEARISELFAERSGGIRAVVTSEDVSRVIAMLGTVEDIAGSALDTDDLSSGSTRPKKQIKRLYRDPDRRYLGGVCAGIAHWTGIHVAIIRLLFVAAMLFWGFSCLIYLFLCMVIPLAKSTAQKLEMMGQPVNISTIAMSAKNSFTASSIRQSINQFVIEVGELIRKIFRVLANILAILLGVILLMTGVCILAGTGYAVFLQDFMFMHKVEWDLLSFNELLRHIITPVSYGTLLVCGVIITLLLVFACFFWGLWLMLRFRVTRGAVHRVLLIAWCGAVLVVVFTGIFEARRHMWRNETYETSAYAAVDTLYFETLPSTLKISNNPLEVYYDKENKRFYGKPDLFIYKSDDNNIKLTIVKVSLGENKLTAYHYAEEIVYQVEVRDSLVRFPLFFTAIPPDQWNFQQVKLRLYLPEGTVVIADRNVYRHLLVDRWRWPPDARTRGTWVMGEKGLQCLPPLSR